MYFILEHAKKPELVRLCEYNQLMGTGRRELLIERLRTLGIDIQWPDARPTVPTFLDEMANIRRGDQYSVELRPLRPVTGAQAANAATQLWEPYTRFVWENGYVIGRLDSTNTLVELTDDAYEICRIRRFLVRPPSVVVLPITDHD